MGRSIFVLEKLNRYDGSACTFDELFRIRHVPSGMFLQVGTPSDHGDHPRPRSNFAHFGSSFASVASAVLREISSNVIYQDVRTARTCARARARVARPRLLRPAVAGKRCARSYITAVRVAHCRLRGTRYRYLLTCAHRRPSTILKSTHVHAFSSQRMRVILTPNKDSPETVFQLYPHYSYAPMIQPPMEDAQAIACRSMLFADA